MAGTEEDTTNNTPTPTATVPTPPSKTKTFYLRLDGKDKNCFKQRNGKSRDAAMKAARRGFSSIRLRETTVYNDDKNLPFNKIHVFEGSLTRVKPREKTPAYLIGADGLMKKARVTKRGVEHVYV